MFVCGENVAQVGSVKNIFEGRQNLDPDVWPIFCWYEAVVKVSN